MAGKGTIGGKIVLEGEKQYSEALKRLRADQAELRSEMKLCTSEFKTSQNSLEALSKKHEILTKTIDTQTRKVEVYQKAMEFCAQKQEQAAEKVRELQTALAREEKALEDLKLSSEDNSQAIEAQAKVVAELTQKLSQAEAGYNKAEQKTKSYQTAVNNATAELNDMQSDLDATSKYLAEAEASTDKCASSIDEYGKETQEASEKTNIFGDVLKANLASEVIIAGVKKLANGIKEIAESSIETGASFEASMSQVAATMGMTADEIAAGSKSYELLSDAAKECGKSTKYSASEAAEALNYLALAGYDAAKSAETLPKVLDLAAAGGLDLAYASDLVTDSMAALGLETSELNNYIDEMARTSQKSNTSVAQLGEATLVCAGTVSMAGQSLETMNAELGILANNGIKGAEGGTHLRNVILSLSAPTKKAAIAIEELGLQINDKSGNMRDLNDILRDMDAAMEGMSSAKRTNIISRIFNKTDIGAVNALLKGTGQEFDNLVDELKDCSGAAADMAATMNDNLRGKVTILQSALEGLGISVYEVFDEDLKSVVDGATDAVGRLQESIDNGDLGVSLNKMSEALGKFCEGAIEVGEDALPVLIDGLTWLLDNSDLIIAGVTGIVAANIQMNTVAPAIEAVKTAWVAYKEKTEAATVAQWLLDAAMEANPAGILLTAIVGLTAAVGAYILINKDSLTVMDETSRKSKELVEETKKLNDTYADSASERKQAREGMELEAIQAKKLADELKTLAEKTDRTREEEVRMKMIVEQLNQLVPDLNLAINEQTGELNMSTDALEKNVDAMMAMARAEAAREDLTRIASDQYEAEKKLLELNEQKEEQFKVLAQLQNELTEAENRYNASSSLVGNHASVVDLDKLRKASEAAIQAKEAYEAIRDEVAATEDTIAALGDEYANTMVYISEQSGMAEAATEALGAEALETAEDFREMEAETSDAVTEMYDSVYESVQKQMDIFTEFRGEAKLSTEELLNNMQSQVDGVTKWAENLEELADRGINQGLLQHLANLGPEGAGYVATFAEMTDEELQKANKLFEDALVVPEETARKVAESYEKTGQNAADSYKGGIEKQSGEVDKMAGKMTQGSVDRVKETLGISGNYSMVMLDIGQEADRGLEQGITEGKSNVAAAAERVSNAVISSMKSKLQKSECVTTGRRVPEGLSEGITSGQNTAARAAETVCSAVSAAMSKVQKSEWVSTGGRIPEGLAEGITSGTNAVTKAVSGMVSAALSEAKKALDINSPSKKFAYMGEMSGEGYISGWEKSMANIDDVIANSLPDTSMPAERQHPSSSSSDFWPEGGGGRQINVQQEIKLYALKDDPIDAAKKFYDAQREAAGSW